MDPIDTHVYSNSEVVIDVSHVTKTFKVYLDKGNTLKERMIFSNRRRYELRHVLNDISFQVHRGEAIGLIGHNGCGKSTTLKLLTRIMYPDSGSITMQGRVSSLIELGAGFHPDMSGRENIYINASIFGLTKKEIDARIDDIITFSELEEFIDNPVRTYSSGMYTRLAFAVAINVSADILLIDEILAVGDAGFQAKCFNKLREIKKNGTTIVLVSHSMGQVEQLCDRSIWIHEGKILQDGPCKEVDTAYLAYMDGERRKREEDELHKQATKSARVVVRDAAMGDIAHADLDAVAKSKGFDENEVSEIDGTVFTWMRENEAALVLGASLTKGNAVACIPYHTESHLAEPVEASLAVNGKTVINQVSLTADGQFAIPIPASGKPATIIIRVSHLWSPHDVLGTADYRKLGVQVVLSKIYLISVSQLPDAGGVAFA